MLQQEVDLMEEVLSGQNWELQSSRVYSPVLPQYWLATRECFYDHAFHLLAHSSTCSSSMAPLKVACHLGALRRHLSLRTPVDLASSSLPCCFLCGGESVSGVSVGSRSGQIPHHRMCKDVSCWGRLFLSIL